MSKCVCKGNWRNIINECDDHIGKKYFDKDLNVWRFIGVLWAEDDYYYAFYSTDLKEYMFSTCVISFDQTIKFNNFTDPRG